MVLRDVARARDQEHQLPRVKQRRDRITYRPRMHLIDRGRTGHSSKDVDIDARDTRFIQLDWLYLDWF